MLRTSCAKGPSSWWTIPTDFRSSCRRTSSARAATTPSITSFKSSYQSISVRFIDILCYLRDCCRTVGREGYCRCRSSDYAEQLSFQRSCRFWEVCAPLESKWAKHEQRDRTSRQALNSLRESMWSLLSSALTPAFHAMPTTHRTSLIASENVN